MFSQKVGLQMDLKKSLSILLQIIKMNGGHLCVLRVYRSVLASVVGLGSNIIYILNNTFYQKEPVPSIL